MVVRQKLSEKIRTCFDNDRPLVPLALILLLGVVAYANSFTVPLQYDDVMTLRKNLSNPIRIGFQGGARWVTDLSFGLNRLAHGETVFGYHLVNLAIHLFSALVLYFLVRSALEALRSSFNLASDGDQAAFLGCFAPFAAAAVFVTHPVQTQAVTYIAQRYASLAALFYLTAMLLFVKARSQDGGRLKWLWWGGSATAALLAVMSKENAFTLPLMIVALEITLFRGVMLKKPLFLAAGIGLLLIIPLQLLQRLEQTGVVDIPGILLKVTTEVDGLSRGDYLLTQIRVVVTYLRLLLLPVQQNLDYDYPIQTSLFEPAVLASLALHLALAAVAVLFFSRSRIALLSGNFVEGAATRLGALGLIWFYLALSVESSIIPIRDVIYEHRLYLPSGGIFMAVACLAAGRADTVRRRTVAWWLLAGCCLTLTVATIARNQVWQTPLGLWQDVLAKSPNKARPQYQVGFFLAQQGRPDKALPHLVRSLELTPTAIDVWVVLNSAVRDLGVFAGRYNDGQQYHLMVFTIDPGRFVPWQALSHNNLGLAYEYLGNQRAAQVNFEKAALLNPELDLAWLNQVVNAAQRHDRQRLAMAFKRLEALNPRLAREVVTQLKLEM